MKKLQKKNVIFHYKSKNRRPKRLENNVFVIFSPEKFSLNPGERKTVNMQIKISIPRGVDGTCTLLLELSNQKLKLTNSNFISQKYNPNIETEDDYNDNNLPYWNLIFELFNGNFTKPIQIKNKQELGYFYLLHDRGEEINFKYKIERQC